MRTLESSRSVPPTLSLEVRNLLTRQLNASGTAISTYDVQDKKQVAEFDFQQWLGENVEEEQEDTRPCPVCNSAEREEVLLLCDSCDAAYHTFCLGLPGIPQGNWYCIECQDLFRQPEEEAREDDDVQIVPPPPAPRPQPREGRGYHVRTRERLRRARRQARHVEWQGAWEQFADRVYDLSDVDLNNADDESEELEQFRRMQQVDRQELERWQQRISIANRLGARDTFTNNIPPQISEHLRPRAPTPPPATETREERRAWIALERALEAERAESSGTTTNTRKRKTRSVTASPSEPPQEPERKLKRPRTRRLPTAGEASSSAASPAQAGPSTARNGQAQVTNGTSNLGRGRENNEPQLVSSLLKELESNAASDDDTAGFPGGWRAPHEASSPALSPSPSAYSSPRALSLTPPPRPMSGRPESPTPLSSHIQPLYMSPNYLNLRNGSRNGSRNESDAGSDSESRPARTENRSLELRQPRPRRTRPANPRAEEPPANRASMTQEEKKNINEIVKSALRPHWRAQKLTSDQYVIINRDISRKLYEEVRDATSLDDETRRSWEKRATQEVAQAVEGLQA
jgi:hypothetical protein